ncbi:peptidoglycan recognition protein family protein [Streptomyces zaomyceticus]|uniref:peptidoglycan recognition protein family protein n=1 Tax=Streptomyces zaomyceticus TaxID=68286 RepID=UPI0034213D7A
MAIIRRAQYGLPATSPAAYIGSTRGVKVHYLGTPYSSRPHSQCPAYVRQIRESHLANTKENYSDIAYNHLVCEHGDAYEGRGPHHRTGANGNAELNTRDYAVCALLGSSGLTQPTDAMLHGIRDAIEDLRENGGAGDWIGGHRDGYATDCPGGPLYAWVQAGAPRPKKNTEEDDMDPVDVWAYKGTGETRDAYWYQRDTNALAKQARDETRALAARLDRLEKQPLTDAQIAAIATAIAATPKLADAIADKLAARLAN